jgi:hypothetical protein
MSGSETPDDHAENRDRAERTRLAQATGHSSPEPPQAGPMWDSVMAEYLGSFTAIQRELIENALGIALSRGLEKVNVWIRLEEVDEKTVSVTVEDDAGGIRDLGKAVTMAEETEDHLFGEHRAGLNHALAALDQRNDSWKLCTRSEEDTNEGRYHQLEAPYTYGEEPKVHDKEWPGRPESNTLMDARTSRALVQKVQEGVKGQVKRLSKLAEHLADILGGIYAPHLGDMLDVTIEYETEHEEGEIQVSPVTPPWLYTPGKTSFEYDFGEGPVEVRIETGLIAEEDAERDDDDSLHYYNRDQETNGVEIRFNGVLVRQNVLREVYNRKNHQSLTRFVEVVDLRTDDPSRLPATQTDSTEFALHEDTEDELYRLIYENGPTPSEAVKVLDDDDEGPDESDLVDALVKAVASRGDSRTVETEKPLLDGEDHIYADLYSLSNDSDGDNLVIEAKKGVAGPDAVLQLLGYVLAELSEPNRRIDEGILVAQGLTDSAETLLNTINGHLINEEASLTHETWTEMGVIRDV